MRYACRDHCAKSPHPLSHTLFHAKPTTSAKSLTSCCDLSTAHAHHWLLHAQPPSANLDIVGNRVGVSFSNFDEFSLHS